MDNKGDMVISVKHAKYLAQNPRVVSIFGPVKSENVIAVATFANEKHIPIISPTAEYSNITELGPWLFQANVNLQNIGDYLGKYCTSLTENPNIVTLAPLNSKGEKLIDSFSEAIDVTGGRIVSQQWYNGTPQQLKIQFNNIRQSGVVLAREKLKIKVEAFRDSLRMMSMEPGSRWNSDDSFLNVTDSICQLFENGAIRELNIKQTLLYAGMMSKNEFKMPTVDSLDQKIYSIDGFFIPASREDLALIIPKIKYYNFSCNIYGTRNLSNSNLLKKNSSVARNFHFITDYYIDESSQKYQQVINDYIRITGEKPDRFGVYGYDTMEVLLMAYYNSNITRKGIHNQLMTMPVYQGIGRNISFNGNQPRSNSCAFILTYRRGNIIPVARVENGNIIFVR